MELKFKESKKNYYILTILGSIRTGKYSRKYETIVSQCSDKNWSDIDALFFSYIAKGESGSWRESRNYEVNDKDGAHYGRDFKFGPVGPYIGWWCVGEKSDNISLDWDDIHSVKIQHVNNDGVIEDVELPDIDSIYPTEDEFMSAFMAASDKRASEIERSTCEDGEILEPWDLPLLRKILIANGWNEKCVNNIFYKNRDAGFIEIDPSDAYTFSGEKALEVLESIKVATSDDGTRYTGFKPETFAKIETAVNGSELPEITKQVVLSVLRNYSNMVFPQDYVIKSLKETLFEFNKLGGVGTRPLGPAGYSGIYMSKVTPDIDLEELYKEDDEIFEYNGETYTIHESD